MAGVSADAGCPCEAVTSSHNAGLNNDNHHDPPHQLAQVGTPGLPRRQGTPSRPSPSTTAAEWSWDTRRLTCRAFRVKSAAGRLPGPGLRAEACDSTLEGALLMATRDLDHQMQARIAKPLGRVPPGRPAPFPNGGLRLRAATLPRRGHQNLAPAPSGLAVDRGSPGHEEPQATAVWCRLKPAGGGQEVAANSLVRLVLGFLAAGESLKCRAMG